MPSRAQTFLALWGHNRHHQLVRHWCSSWIWAQARHDFRSARWCEVAMNPSKYGPFEFSAIAKRPSWRWPNGAKVAFWICANIEVFHLDTAMPNDSQERPTGREAIPMVRQWAQRDFGNRVGVWRMMDVLRNYGVRASAATNSEICVHMPVIVEEMVKLDWEIMGHGKTNTHRVNEIPPEQEE